LHIIVAMEPILFDAIADPTRRALLDRLRAKGAQSITELAADLPMTRQAVTKHLDALAAARLVRVRRTGRERMHELDGRPLREVDEWLRPYAEAWDRRLDALRTHLEEDEG
jgi:DNA-binding transcriptional ArsR family regulator